MNINRADVWKYAITWLNVKHQCISLAKLCFINEHLNKTVLALHMINRNWIKWILNYISYRAHHGKRNGANSVFNLHWKNTIIVIDARHKCLLSGKY